MKSLLIRNLIFTILQPGIVAGLIPYYISQKQINDITFNSLELFQYAGILIFFMGIIITLKCIFSFAIDGQGTLSPADPTKKLVISGLYKYSRNPMYVGVILILLGEVIFFQTSYLLLYAIFVFMIFNIFIIMAEEPRLKKDFSEEYKLYCRNVRRWL